MKTLHGKRFLALLLSMVLLALCAGSALAAGPAAKSSVGGYALQKTEDSPDGVTLLYKGTGGQISVYYTTEGVAAQRMEIPRQFASDVLLYACYSDAVNSDTIGTVYYTVGSCTVTVRSESGWVDKSEMLSFLQALQASPMPVATGVCAKCGGDVYSYGAKVGSWEETSSGACSHGGTLKYKDTQNQRSVQVTTVCASCGNRTEETLTQSAAYCGYSNRWTAQTLR